MYVVFKPLMSLIKSTHKQMIGCVFAKAGVNYFDKCWGRFLSGGGLSVSQNGQTPWVKP